MMVRDSLTPGAQALGSQHWPADSAIPRHADVSTAIVFLDPRCGCSRASLVEMARLVRQLGTQMKWIAVLHGTAESQTTLTSSTLYGSLAQIPNVCIYLDPQGQETRRFQANVSGELLLYSSGGHLQFQGGLTPARGHEGDSVGALAVSDWVQTGRAECSSSLVYGCQLSLWKGAAQ